MNTRRRRSAAALALLLLGPATAARPADAPIAMSAARFVGSLGVNTHIPYTDGRYLNSGDVIAKLRYLGVAKVRDHVPDPSYDPPGQRNYWRVASAGVRFNLVINGNRPLGDTLASIEQLERACPGAVVSIEGPNEIVHAPVRYMGLAGDEAAAALQRDLYAAVRASRLPADVKVFSYSLDEGSRPSGGYDAVSLHPYPQNGDQPYRWLRGEMRRAPAGDRSVITETGYATLPSWWKGVDAATQAKLTLNLIFDAARLGLEEVFLYELLDAYPDPGGKAGDKHYGLFGYDGKPKPAAEAIRNLTTLLADDASTAPASPAPSFELVDAPADLASLVIRKSDGRTYLALWREPDIWDENAHAPLTAPASSVRVRLAEPHRARLFDPLRGAEPIEALGEAAHLSVLVSDHVVLVELENPRAPSAPTARAKPRRACALAAPAGR